MSGVRLAVRLPSTAHALAHGTRDPPSCRTPAELAHAHALAHASRQPRAGLSGGPRFPDALWLRLDHHRLSFAVRSLRELVDRLDPAGEPFQITFERSPQLFGVCAAVEGLPGIGKTELVLKLAYELAAAGEFPGGIFWLPAEAPDLIAAWSSDEIAGALGQVGETMRERALNTVNMLSRRDTRVLIILDNVEAWDKNTQPAPLPNGPNITLLVTTRKSHLGGNRFTAFKLEFLGPAEARALVTGLAGAEVATRPGFDDLLDFLDGHALAVELAGIYLREYPEVTPAAYLAGLQAGRDLSAKVADETRYEASVNQVFDLLWQRLGEDTRKAWQLASWFAPEPASPALASACSLDSAARRALHRFHLVDLDGEGRFRMHRLTRAFGQSAGDAEARGSARRAFLDGVTARAEQIDIAAGFRIYLPDRAHFEEAIRLAAEEPGDAKCRSTLLDSIGTACHSMGALARARDLLEKALASDIKNLGEDHPEVAIRRYNLAGICEQEGDLVASLGLLRSALRSELVSLGADHPSAAMTRAKIASLLSRLGEHEEARKEAREAVRMVASQPKGSSFRTKVETLTAGLL